MRAGLLNETVTFKCPEVIKDDYGQEETTWKDYIKTRCKVYYKSGNRVTENNEIINTYNVEFTVRYYHNINEQMRILYNGKLYRILAINKDRLKQSITITGEMINE